MVINCLLNSGDDELLVLAQPELGKVDLEALTQLRVSPELVVDDLELAQLVVASNREECPVLVGYVVVVQETLHLYIHLFLIVAISLRSHQKENLKVVIRVFGVMVIVHEHHRLLLDVLNIVSVDEYVFGNYAVGVVDHLWQQLQRRRVLQLLERV